LNFLFNGSTIELEVLMAFETVISLSRQFGSGGRAIGHLIADKLEIPYYDSALINLAAEKSGMSKQVLENLDEKAGNRFLYTVPSTLPNIGSHPSTSIYNMPLSDKLFLTEYEIIKKIAQEGAALIVGRCADYILKEMKNHVAVFIHAPEDFRAERVAEYENISVEKAKSELSKYDRQRRKYHDYYAAGTWGEATYYDLTINSATLGLEGTAEFISQFVLDFNKKL
jgi:cytidylate kinase